MGSLARDMRYAVRALARTPIFALGIILTLGLGIGVNAAMFGIVDTLFLRAPSGVHDAGSLTRLYMRRTDPFFGQQTQASTNYPAFADVRASGAFARASALAGATLSWGRGPDAQEVRVAGVSGDFFAMVGVPAARGRVFGPDDDRDGAPRVAVVTDAFWRGKLAGDPAAVGRSLELGAHVYTVIGVTPPGFGGIDLMPQEVFVPIAASVDEFMAREALTSRNYWFMSVLGQLAPGASREAVAARATAAYRSHAEDKFDSTATAVLGPIQEARGPEASSDAKVSAWIGIVALVVLLIACANVANLLLARGLARRRELAVRAGLGAGRGGLIRMILAESLVLAAAGGVAAIVLAAWTGAAARSLLIPDMPAGTAVIDGTVLLFTLGAVVLTALLTGLVPAIQFSRADVADALKSGGRATLGHGRTRAALLVTQIALTLVLLVGAGLFVRSLRNVQHLDLGFDPDRVVEARLARSGSGMSRAEATATYLRLVERLQRLPAVQAAAATMTPFGWGMAISMHAEGIDSIPRAHTGGPYINAVTPGYFATLGTRLVRGRSFTDQDVKGAPRVAVVAEWMAHRLWPRGDAIGKCLYLGSDTTTVCTQIVGIMGDVKRSDVTESEALMYWVPFLQLDSTLLGGGEVNALVVRARGRAADLVDPVRREIQASGNVPYPRVHTLAEQVAPQYRSWELGAGAFTAFGLLALVIAAMGIFAVISYSVGQRTQEIGVRMALGAEARQVARMVLGQGMRTAAAGVVLGAAGGWALGRGVRSLLFGVAPADPLVFVSVAVVLLGVAALAAWLPARRAARIDPMVALRYD